MRPGLTDADLDERVTRARTVLAGEPLPASVPSPAAVLATDVLAVVAELRWWREHYGSDSVPFTVVMNDGGSDSVPFTVVMNDGRRSHLGGRAAR